MHLQKFISSFEFTKMSYAPELLIKIPDTTITRLLAEPGKQYALYIHHSQPYEAEPTKNGIWKYEADTSEFTDRITIYLEAGRYRAKWYNPVTGKWKGKRIKWKQKAGDHTFFTGPFITDIALSIKSK
jgi:hypothetical protein